MASINQNPSTYITYGQMNLINDFRALWTEVVIWMRSYMVSTITGFSDINAIKNRINRIPWEMKLKLQPFLGVDLAERFQSLLSMYLNHAQILVDAQSNKNQEAMNNTVSALYRDVDNMADFLASINPYWSKSQWQNLFNQLTEMGITEIVAIFSGNYTTEIDLRDRMLKLGLVLGDYMASGVMHYLSPDLNPPSEIQKYPRETKKSS